ncbi:MAG: hypothetical protein R2745_23610 [Vicinamibacterales bacterium]
MPDSEVAARLREVIVALDERHVQPGRVGEARIAQESSDMRARAVARLAELRPEPPGNGRSITTAPAASAGPPVSRQCQEVPMTAPVPVGSSAPSPGTDVPADFDAAMTERWHAWRERGRVEHAHARRHGLMAVALAGVVALAALVLSAFTR